jgi:hypothetical protein
MDETCEIEAVYTNNQRNRARFWAKAQGAEGEYNADESEEFVCTEPIEDDLQAQDPLQALIRRLVEQKWEPLHEHGSHWYSYRFKRHIEN